MGQQTNEFQQILRMIQKAVAPTGATVTESAMVDVPGLRTLREVDILVETHIGPYKVKVAVEAKDEARPMDVGELESLIAKYRGEGRVRVDKIVVVTKAGFTSGAREKAQLLDVELFTLTQASDLEWNFLKPQKLLFQQPPHLCSVVVTPELPQALRRAIINSGLVYCSHGDCKGTVMSMVKAAVGELSLRQPGAILEVIALAKKAGKAGAKSSVKMSHEHHIAFREQKYPLEKIEFMIHAVLAQGEAECKAVVFSSVGGEPQEFLYMTSTIDGKQFQFLMPNVALPEQIQMSVSPVKPKRRQAARNTRDKKRRKHR